MLNKEELYNFLQDNLGLNEEQCKDKDKRISVQEFPKWLKWFPVEYFRGKSLKSASILLSNICKALVKRVQLSF